MITITYDKPKLSYLMISFSYSATSVFGV